MAGREYAASLDFDLTYVTISSIKKDDQGQAISIHPGEFKVPRWTSIHIYEDLFGNFMSCEITLNDRDGFFLNRLRTEEIIAIKFKTPDLDGYSFKERTHNFYLYKIEPVVLIDNPPGAIYTIKGISFEYFYNSLRTFSKSYSGKTEKIAKEIYSEFLESKISRVLKKPIRVGRPTKNEMKFTFPYMNPVDAINHLASVSVDESNPEICNYVFFENKDGFNFTSITELIQNPRKLHKFITKKTFEKSISNFSAFFNNTIRISPTRTSDKIIDTLDGVYGEYFSEFDLLYKKFTPYINTNESGKKTFGKRYLENFDKTKHLNKTPLLSKENELFQNPLGRNRVCFTNAALYAEPDENNPTGWRLYDTFEGEYSFQRRSMMQQINSFNVEVAVPGNSEVTVGDIVDLDTTIYRTEDPDKYLSGRYLVTAVCHSMVIGEGYQTVMTLSRDSIKTDDFTDKTEAAL
jgi:hypothetical protein